MEAYEEFAEEEEDGLASVQRLPPMEWIPRALRVGEGNELERLQKAWPEVVSKCRVVAPLIARLLKDCWPESLDGNRLVIGVDPEFADEMDQLRRNERGSMRNLFHRFLGRAIHLEYTVLKEPVRWSHHKPEDQEVEDDEPFDPATAEYNKNQWARDPALRLLLDRFNGSIIDIQL